MMFVALPSMDMTSLPFEVEPNAGNHLAWMNVSYAIMLIGALAFASVFVSF